MCQWAADMSAGSWKMYSQGTCLEPLTVSKKSNQEIVHSSGTPTPPHSDVLPLLQPLFISFKQHLQLENSIQVLMPKTMGDILIKLTDTKSKTKSYKETEVRSYIERILAKWLHPGNLKQILQSLYILPEMLFILRKITCFI